MRKRSRIFAVVVAGSLWALGGLSAFVSGCGASDFSGPGGFGDGGVPWPDAATPTPDGASGADVFIPPFDGSASDASASDASASADAGGPTRILAVHASANLDAFRLCFGMGGHTLPIPAYPDDPTHPMPESNYPGVPVGGAALLPPLDLGGVPVLAPYVISAKLLNDLHDVSTSPNERTCEALICDPASLSTCLAKNQYYRLPDVRLPAHGGTVALAITGCVEQTAATPGSIAQCGGDYVATGNLGAAVATLSPSAFDVWTVQIAQLSPSFVSGSGTGDSGAAGFLYVDPTTDASVPLSPPPVLNFPPVVTLPLSDAGVLSAYVSLLPASGPPMSQSLSAIQFFQAPSSNPTTYFRAPSTYFMAIVGDATDAAAPASLPDGAPNPLFDGHGLHVIAYPEQGN